MSVFCAQWPFGGAAPTAARRPTASGHRDARLTGAGVRKHLWRHDLPVLSARSAALHQLLHDIPPPVAASMLGFTNDHLARSARLVGVDWSR